MRICNIEMKNYRQYKDANISFEKKGKNDIHLLIAKNGSGKSNFLNAITWCLYDKEPHLSEKNTALPIINMERLEEMNFGEKKDISVEIKVKSDNMVWFITRVKTVIKVDDKIEPIIEKQNKLKITEKDKYGNINEIKEDEIKDRIKIMFPEGLREYFFFDNEQLNKYFNNNKAESIKESIYTISQISELNRIEDRLNKVKKLYEKKMGNDNIDLEKQNKKVINLEKDIENNRQSIGVIEGQISESERILKEIDAYLSDSEDIRKLQKLEKEKESLIVAEDEDFENKKKEIQAFAIRYEILIRLYPNLKELKKMLEIETKEYGDNAIAYMSAELVSKVLKTKKCLICNKEIDYDVEERLKDVLKQLNNKNNSISELERLKRVVDSLLKETKEFPEKRNKLAKELDRIDNRREIFYRDLEEIKSKINKFADKSKAANYIEQKEEHNKYLEDNRMKKARLEAERQDLEREKNKEIKERDKLIEKDKVNKKLKVKINRTKEMINIIRSVKEELITEIKEKVRKETFENFNKLIWKKSTYKNVEIDDQYNVNLINKDGFSARGSCSAAETSLLALSFTLALHSISGFDAPLVIDSPVGRISDENRENFTKVLFDVSKNKEIILLFSPSEYSDEVQNIIKDNYSSKRNIIVTNDEREVMVQ